MGSMVTDIAAIEHLTERIIGCAIEVHKTLGAGLLESVYRECLIIEMRNAQLSVESERCINLTYKGVPISSKLRLDLLVEDTIVVELKAVECIHPIHKSQVITYLKLSKRKRSVSPNLLPSC
jgi:GxxExxY protein